MPLTACPDCGREISTEAPACPGCGRPTRAATIASLSGTEPKPGGPSPGVAAVLSLVIPGAGQMYAGSIGQGIMWLLFTVFCYMLVVVPGLIVHIICVFNAASTARSASRG